MSYKVTNIINGQIVCDLATEGKTLRLNSKETVHIDEKDMTNHIQILSEKGLVKVVEVANQEKTATKRTTAKKAVSKHNKED